MRAMHHSPELAADEAVKFAQIAFIESDSKLAHSLLWPTFKNTISVAQLTTALDQIHPTGRPTAITATEYEPIMGEKQMNIFLVGTNHDETFYYRLVLCGTSDSGYKVGGMFRGNQKHPPSKIRKPLNKLITVTKNTEHEPPEGRGEAPRL
jgi:hypothetical protein